MHPRLHGILRVVALTALVLAGRPSLAETTVPLDVQADLLCKVVRFERSFFDRADSEVNVLLVDLPSNPRSGQAGKQLAQVLGRMDVAGRKIRTVPHHYTSPAALKKGVENGQAQIVFFMPGFDAHVKDIAAGLEGVHVITVTTDGDQVPVGVVLGFELVSSRPKISVNLAQAKKQNLDFNSDLFRLAKVFR